ncbi:DUF2254 domain-containing protein [Planomicrobium sp. CPCC 101079]|uniref:DUF2254 domain-containing protein n=1 Tax=Planomicrobium sp. CPCC 101079 TaxID=2599618 RepID=UPI0011B5424F|nr:DUF2254 domain-containing protein [Planomicrobium sp. CPCC 101079]TWT11137.1 DUF2254 domain-containing protein [Planomicrobium sp. CPCC 101079]
MKPISYTLKEKVWITPALYSIGAILLSLAAFYFDLYFVERLQSYIPSIFLTSVEVGQTILGILTAAMLTMTTFTFSTVLVVLTTYTSQFSPRAPENFIRSRSTKHVLGIFVASFIFNMLSLLYIREDVFDHEILTTAIGIFIVFFSIATFAYYIHFVATNVQISTLINKLIDDAEDVISQYIGLQDENYVSLTSWEPKKQRETLKAKSRGYIQFLDLVDLVKIAEKHDIQIEVLVKIGDYVYKGKPLMHIYKEDSQKLSLDEFLTVGDERTAEQDLGYAIQKIVEVAIRAISPGRQDPNTTNDILIRLGHLLGEMGHLKTDDLVLADTRNQNRIHYRFASYREILYRTFYQLSYQGRNDISVISSMTESLTVAAALAPKMRHETIWKTQLYILEGINDEALKDADWEFLQSKIDELAEMTEQRPVRLEALFED